MVLSSGTSFQISRRTVSPPIPESKTPTGLLSVIYILLPLIKANIIIWSYFKGFARHVNVHVVLRDPAEHYLAREELLVSDLLSVISLEMHIDLVPAVIAVTDNRVPQVRELRPDLVRPSRYELELQV